MNSIPEGLDIKLICVIVNFGSGSKIKKSARHYGVSGGTIALGKGTVQNRIMDFIGISDIRKEIVYMAADRDTAYHALEELNREFEFHKPHHGIAFATSISSIIGTRSIVSVKKENERGADSVMYQLITVIVEKGKGEDVITAATEAGSKGGTIINARGSGIHETSKLFSMDIEPEKEIVIILSKKDVTEAIACSIRDKLELEKPGNGIIFIQDVDKTYGIFE